MNVFISAESQPYNMMGDNPPPYHTLPGANAFSLPYGVNPTGATYGTGPRFTQRQERFEFIFYH